MHITLLFAFFISVLPFQAAGVPLSMDRTSASLGVRDERVISVHPRARQGSTSPPPDQPAVASTKTPKLNKYTVLLDKENSEHPAHPVGSEEARKYILSIAMSKEYTTNINEKSFTVLQGLFGFMGRYTEEAAAKIAARKGVKCVRIPGKMTLYGGQGSNQAACLLPDSTSSQHSEAVTPNASGNVDATHPQQHLGDGPKIKAAVPANVGTTTGTSNSMTPLESNQKQL